MPNDVHSVYSLKHSDPFWMLQSTSGGSNYTELNEFAVSASAPDLASATEIRHTPVAKRPNAFLKSTPFILAFPATPTLGPDLLMLTSPKARSHHPDAHASKKVPGS